MNQTIRQRAALRRMNAGNDYARMPYACWAAGATIFLILALSIAGRLP